MFCLFFHNISCYRNHHWSSEPTLQGKPLTGWLQSHRPSGQNLPLNLLTFLVDFNNNKNMGPLGDTSCVYRLQICTISCYHHSMIINNLNMITINLIMITNNLNLIIINQIMMLMFLKAHPGNCCYPGWQGARLWCCKVAFDCPNNHHFQIILLLLLIDQEH